MNQAPTKRSSPHKQSGPFDVVALAASAGGHAAVSAILRGLPADFPVPLIVIQHLGTENTSTAEIYSRRSPFVVEWARPDSELTPGKVLVCPPRTFLEILPDGTCTLAPNDRGALDQPIDRLLNSLARSFGKRAVGVILTGLGNDGAQGALQLHLAGGAVLVQSETSAEFADMPRAAIQSGAAEVVLPLHKIAPVLVDLAAGKTVPHMPTELEAVDSLFSGEGQARAALKGVNWSATPLGPVRGWPQFLLSAVRNVMSSHFPSCIYWGSELVQIYNEAFLPILGGKPAPAGKPARQTWPELWSSMGMQLESVYKTGISAYAQNQLFQSERHGYAEELYFTYSYSPLHDSDGNVLGVLGTFTDTTERVRAGRRLKTLRDLAAIDPGESALQVMGAAARVLADAPLDVPFALFYLLDRGQTRAAVSAALGLEAGAPGAPNTLSLMDEQSVWPLGEVVNKLTPLIVNDLPARLPDVHSGPWPESPTSAILLPMRTGTEGPVAGVLVLGRSPRLHSDPLYDEFLGLIAQRLSTALGETEAKRLERERTKYLSALDRARTDFFSNISHEFRTPLTLLLAPLEELLRRRAELPTEFEPEMDAAVRNGRRLLTLVNNLLDFSEGDARRPEVNFELTDLGAFTTAVASVFRGAIESAGLKFRVQCDPDLPPIWVDRAMWEKIVSNLLSNALKFTFEGEIVLLLQRLSLHAELVIVDTGIGIPEQELPNLFKRFHRVRGARARSLEGSGIGLSIVHDLVQRLGGQIRVRSIENEGTEFTIWIPFQSSRFPAEAPTAVNPPETSALAMQVAQEASRWLVNAQPTSEIPAGVINDILGPPQAFADSQTGKARQGRILIVDNNADLREYLQRLLSPRWAVDLVADSATALETARRTFPDLILSDVMLPGLDGFELLKHVRGDPQLQHTPIILLTAWAGEESTILGLLAGADDYIAKPFSPRELVARVWAMMERARAEQAVREYQKHLVEELSDAKQLQRVSSGLIETDNVEILYEQILDASKAVMRSDMVSMQVLVPERQELHLLAWKGFHAESAKCWEWVRSDSESVCGVALSMGKRIIVPDVERWDALQSEEDLRPYRLSGIRAVQSTPLISRSGQIVGMLSHHWTNVYEPSERELALLDVIARQSADLLERRQAEAALRENKKQLEFLNKSLEQNVQEKTAEVRRLSIEVIRSTQRERQRISQILHNELQQRIYAIQMQMVSLRDGLQEERARQEMSDLEKQLQESLQIARHLSIDLSPPILKEEGLTQAITWLATRMQQQYGLSVEVRADDSFALSDEELYVLLFNCVRELLFNVVKHAQSDHAVVLLQWTDSGLRIEVSDHGKGFTFPPAEGEAGGNNSRRSIGLTTIQHQLSLFGGSLEIMSKPGAGTQIIMIVPIAETASNT